MLQRASTPPSKCIPYSITSSLPSPSRQAPRASRSASSAVTPKPAFLLLLLPPAIGSLHRGAGESPWRVNQATPFTAQNSPVVSHLTRMRSHILSQPLCLLLPPASLSCPPCFPPWLLPELGQLFLGQAERSPFLGPLPLPFLRLDYGCSSTGPLVLLSPPGFYFLLYLNTHLPQSLYILLYFPSQDLPSSISYYFEETLSSVSPTAKAVLWTEKKNARESCKLSFIWGKMRTVAQEIASQIALRNCSREVEGRSV